MPETRGLSKRKKSGTVPDPPKQIDWKKKFEMLQIESEEKVEKIQAQSEEKVQKLQEKV